eukprot:357536-Chlamydomonas_euryale.AAC.1
MGSSFIGVCLCGGGLLRVTQTLTSTDGELRPRDPQALEPHADIGEWWTLYDYGLDAVKGWGADFVPDYPEERKRRRDREAKAAARSARRERCVRWDWGGAWGADFVPDYPEERKQRPDREAETAARSALREMCARWGTGAPPLWLLLLLSLLEPQPPAARARCNVENCLSKSGHH